MHIPTQPAIEPLMVNASGPTLDLITNATTGNSCNDLDHCRTLLQILWSCISVLVACSWVSIHPNLPSPHDSSWKTFRRKVGIMLMVLTAPEFVVLWAARQWYAARKLHEEYQDQGWTRTHGSFAAMGGFMLYEGEKLICVLRYSTLDSDSDSTTTSASRGDTLGDHANLIGRVTELEICDKSHSDGLSKLIAVSQTTWFVLQLISRRVESLPITALEIMTAAYAAINLLIYGFWWNKPQGVRCHVRVQRRVDASIVCGAASDYEQALNIPLTMQDTVLITNIDNPSLPARESFDFQIGTRNFQSRNPWHIKERMKTLYLSALRVLRSSYWRLAATIGQRRERLNSIEKCILYVLGEPFEGLDEKLPSLTLTGPRPSYKREVPMLVAAATIFGVIHCAAWSSAFPSNLDRTLWKASTIVVTFALTMPVLCGVLLGRLDDYIPEPIQEEIFVLVVSLMTLIYVLARITLLVQAFLSLRGLPPGAFETVQWTTLIPHI